MRATIGGNDPAGISGDVFIEEDHLGRRLDNFARRTNARNAGLAAIEDFVGLAFVIGKVFNFGEKLGACRKGRVWKAARL